MGDSNTMSEADKRKLDDMLAEKLAEILFGNIRERCMGRIYAALAVALGVAAKTASFASVCASDGGDGMDGHVAKMREHFARIEALSVIAGIAMTEEDRIMAAEFAKGYVEELCGVDADGGERDAH